MPQPGHSCTCWLQLGLRHGPPGRPTGPLNCVLHLTGLWEFPSLPSEAGRDPEHSRGALEECVCGLPGLAFLGGLGRSWGEKSVTCQHLFSHISMTMTVQRLSYKVHTALPAMPMARLHDSAL